MTGRDGFAAIGNFDGVHRGHQMLLARTVEAATAAGVAPGAVVFDPHPRRFFRPDDPPFLLTTPAERDRLLRAHGAARVYSLAFDSALAALEPERFVAEVLARRLGLAGVVAGADFRFGAGRRGDAAMLVSLATQNGLAALIVEPQRVAGVAEKIGSSGVREALSSGDAAGAARLLGRPWRIEGVVIDGRRLGRTIGVPTANLRLGDLMEPRRGVYAALAHVDGARHPAVVNFGVRPTVDGAAPLLEAHLLDFDGDLYGRTLGVDLIGFLRDERKFDSLDALKAQIAEDIAEARATLAGFSGRDGPYTP